VQYVHIVSTKKTTAKKSSRRNYHANVCSYISVKFYMQKMDQNMDWNIFLFLMKPVFCSVISDSQRWPLNSLHPPHCG